MKASSSARQGIEEFRSKYPDLPIRPSAVSPVGSLEFNGMLKLNAYHEKFGKILDTYYLKIYIPPDFPRGLPQVFETANKIPASGEFHVNPDGTLCLGQPVRILLILSKNPSLSAFMERVLIPYLYAASIKLQNGESLVFDELPHGERGLLEDCKSIFRLKSVSEARNAILALGRKRREANKMLCPCNCGRRLGRCAFRDVLNRCRALSKRALFNSLIRD